MYSALFSICHMSGWKWTLYRIPQKLRNSDLHEHVTWYKEIHNMKACIPINIPNNLCLNKCHEGKYLPSLLSLFYKER